MKVQASRRVSCRLCDGRDLELVVPLSPTPVAEKYVTEEELNDPTPAFPLDLYMCCACGHVQMLDIVNPAFLWDNFTYQSGQNKDMVNHFEDCVQKICRRIGSSPGDLVVDIGSNDGTLLRSFKKRGMTVLGVDPAKDIAAKATSSGIETIPDFLSMDLARKIRTERGPAKCVAAFNVFAHADDLAGMAECVRHLLAPDGVFIFEVSYLLDIVDHMLLGTIFHEHLSHHSMKPMAGFLKRHGLDLIDVERVPIQGGSVVGLAQMSGGPHCASPTVGELLDLELRRGLDRPETMKTFSERIRRLRDEVGNLTSNFGREGKIAAGYGAARSGTTLICQLDLGKTIRFIVDDHPQKVNKFSPGHHIPVVPTSELLVRRPDYCFILAWIHAKKIMAGNAKYLEEGGRFIVACPEVTVVGWNELSAL